MIFEQKLLELKIILDKKLEIFFAKIKAKDLFIDHSYKVLSNYVMDGGKRIRPAALIMAYQGFGGSDDEIYDIALSVEFMHNSTLVHDDIMDEDSLRRNKPTIHESMRKWFLKSHQDKNHSGTLFNGAASRFAATAAICDGNVLLSLGSLLLSSSKLDAVLVRKALRTYSNAYRIINQGQIMDTLLELNEVVKEEDYLAMAEQKTGELFKASVKIGAILAGADETDIESISNYAGLIATSFQIQDDIMDINPKMNKGHEIGSDIRKGKKTLLMIKSLELARSRDRKLLAEIMTKNNATDEEVQTAIEIINQSGALGYCNRIASDNSFEAKKILGRIGLKKEAFDFFSGLADFVVERKV